MSYILDALKKSERERAIGNVPSLESVYGHGRLATPDRQWLVWLVLFFLIVVVTAAVVWYGWKPRQEGVYGDTPRDTPSSGMVESDVVANEGGLATSKDIEDTAEEAIRPVPAQMVVEQKPAPSSLVRISQLPEDIRKTVSELNLNVVSYSDIPEKRFVMIDLVLYREGDSIAAGPVVHRVTADGAVLEYRGYRFQIRP